MTGELETNAYYALGAPLCLALGVLEYLAARRGGRAVYRFADTVGSRSGRRPCFVLS